VGAGAVRARALAALLAAGACAGPDEPYATADLRGALRTAAGAPAPGVPVLISVVGGTSCAGAVAYQLRTTSRPDGAYAARIVDFREGELRACVAVEAASAAGQVRAGLPAVIRAGETTDLGVLTLR
jgi:hypothetical protein